MNRKSVHHRLKQLATMHGMPEDAMRPMEFFFYAPSEDSAANLSISLHELGYTLYGSAHARPDASTIAVTGHTPLMSTVTKVIAGWYEEMSHLAEKYGCDFDGYGTLITEPEEGWDSML